MLTFAQATVTAPVDVGPLITSAITVLGGVVAVAAAGYLGFLVVMRGLRWAGFGLGKN
ncbi:MAG: hypothetical protein AAGD07_00595 [Planctomycetota bacterium]